MRTRAGSGIDEAGCVAETKASLMRATEFGQFVQTQSGPAAVLASRAEQPGHVSGRCRLDSGVLQMRVESLRHGSGCLNSRWLSWASRARPLPSSRTSGIMRSARERRRVPTWHY